MWKRASGRLPSSVALFVLVQVYSFDLVYALVMALIPLNSRRQEPTKIMRTSFPSTRTSSSDMSTRARCANVVPSSRMSTWLNNGFASMPTGTYFTGIKHQAGRPSEEQM
jgi:hypothetical protein